MHSKDIEVDVDIHHEGLVAANDVVRQARLEEAGFTVLRFDNAMVLQRIGGLGCKRVLD
jgi:very-short-patch-repair endonuclease